MRSAPYCTLQIISEFLTYPEALRWLAELRGLDPATTHIACIEHLELYRRLKPSAQGDRSPAEFLELVGLSDKAKEKPPGLSGGMKRKLSVAIALRLSFRPSVADSLRLNASYKPLQSKTRLPSVAAKERIAAFGSRGASCNSAHTNRTNSDSPCARSAAWTCAARLELQTRGNFEEPQAITLKPSSAPVSTEACSVAKTKYPPWLCPLGREPHAASVNVTK